MKKVFFEPEVLRIDLKMTENIAASLKPVYTGITGTDFSGIFSSRQFFEGCVDYVADTEFDITVIDNMDNISQMDKMKITSTCMFRHI